MGEDALLASEIGEEVSLGKVMVEGGGGERLGRGGGRRGEAGEGRPSRVLVGSGLGNSKRGGRKGGGRLRERERQLERKEGRRHYYKLLFPASPGSWN